MNYSLLDLPYELESLFVSPTHDIWANIMLPTETDLAIKLQQVSRKRCAYMLLLKSFLSLNKIQRKDRKPVVWKVAASAISCRC